ncbi:hypothetical protein [Nocardia sp. alder85J]|uniref:hypothetical protein n=1 Tax=Nocardia sp. alder85J TaxID=2862949 RepID=UPI001CD495BA|nr:hypothetical protein [Nocardia sp. alder85J]MCX4096406.1 hypothetical protein [Nocardia sp. alder85J]
MRRITNPFEAGDAGALVGGGGAQLDPRLRSYPLPIPTPDVPVMPTWHARHERDGGHRRLRTLVGETLATIGGAS